MLLDQPSAICSGKSRCLLELDSDAWSSFHDGLFADAAIVGEGVLLHHVHLRQAAESSL